MEKENKHAKRELFFWLILEKWRSGTDIYLEGLESSVLGPFGSKEETMINFPNSAYVISCQNSWLEVTSLVQERVPFGFGGFRRRAGIDVRYMVR